MKYYKKLKGGDKMTKFDYSKLRGKSVNMNSKIEKNLKYDIIKILDVYEKTLKSILELEKSITLEELYSLQILYFGELDRLWQHSIDKDTLGVKAYIKLGKDEIQNATINAVKQFFNSKSRMTAEIM